MVVVVIAIVVVTVVLVMIVVIGIHSGDFTGHRDSLANSLCAIVTKKIAGEDEANDGGPRLGEFLVGR